MKTIAVLLTVHNRKDKTLKCLENLYAQVGFGQDYTCEVYLTDDGSTDGTSEAVRVRFPKIHIVKGDGNLFWNRGMRAAWQEAAKYHSDYFLWINDDTFLYPDSVKKLINAAQQYKDNAIFIGSTCDTATRSVVTYGGLNSKRETVYSNTEFLTCFYMHGNIVLIPQQVYNVVGMNDAYYRHSLGDHDYGLMAQKQGFKVLVAPGKYGECDVHHSIAKWKNPSYPFSQRWRAFWSPTGQNPIEFFYFRKKHFGCLAACKTFITNFIHLMFPALWKNNDYR